MDTLFFLVTALTAIVVVLLVGLCGAAVMFPIDPLTDADPGGDCGPSAVPEANHL